jgi:uncharacterized membrane protein YphA (DoxX/SURF4 family)
MSKLAALLPTVARMLLGFAFFVFGLNGFFNFLPHPPLPEAANQFLGALAGSGYFFPLLKGTETLCGALLIMGAFVPLALTVLAPILVNIVAFHAFLAPAGLPLPLFLVALELYLAWVYRDVFAPVLKAFTDEAASVRIPIRRIVTRRIRVSHG